MSVTRFSEVIQFMAYRPKAGLLLNSETSYIISIGMLGACFTIVGLIVVNVFLNVLWLLCGGWVTALSWLWASVCMFVSIVGIPWGRASFNIALLNLWPFGAKVIPRRKLKGKMDLGTGFLGFLGNLIWLIFAGWWLALVHLFWALINALTIVGLPFAVQHLKLARISLAPIGKSILFE